MCVIQTFLFNTTWVLVKNVYFKLSFTIQYLSKATTDTDSSSVPVLGYYCMPFISLDPNYQLLVFPYTLTYMDPHTLFTFPCTLSLLWSHSLSVSYREPATTDARHKPLTPNPTHAPIFGGSEEWGGRALNVVGCSIKLESWRLLSGHWLTRCYSTCPKRKVLIFSSTVGPL